MKSSEVLLAALERMDGGRKWARGRFYSGEACCSIGALRLQFGSTDLMKLMRNNAYFKARSYLSRVTGGAPDEWNDSAPDFSVIEKGFQKAIELAITEGD